MFLEIKTDQKIRKLNIEFSDDGTGADVDMTSSSESQPQTSKPKTYDPDARRSFSSVSKVQREEEDVKPFVLPEEDFANREAIVDENMAKMNF